MPLTYIETDGQLDKTSAPATNFLLSLNFMIDIY